jgi:dTDP-4-amino-4,6-dideoxygalactose transaminase
MIVLPQLTQGPNLQAFEDELCEMLGAKYAVVCNSGTAALHLAYMAAGLDRGKRLLTTPLTFLATANAARMCQADVDFADVDPATGNVTGSTVAAALAQTDRSYAAIAVTHLAGRPCDLPALRKLANSHGCALIEDAAHAPFASYADENGTTHLVGSCAHSDAVTLSFHAIKHAPMGEGGAVMTNNKEIADAARSLRNHGMLHDPALWKETPESDAPWYYEMHRLGWNYRATEFECALGRNRLSGVRANIAERQKIAGLYHDSLQKFTAVGRPDQPVLPGGNSWHLYPVSIDFKNLHLTRGKVMRSLFDSGIGTQVHYIPVYKQPYYAELNEVFLPGAELYYDRTLSLPMYSGLDIDDLDQITDALGAALNL